MKKRVIALIMCVAIVFTSFAVPASAGMIIGNKRGLIGTFIHGYPMNDLSAVLVGFYQVNKFVNNLLGVPLFTEEKLVVTVDDTIQGILDEIVEEKNVDFGNIINNLPSISRSAEVITSSFKVNIPELRKDMQKAAEQARKENIPVVPEAIELMRVWLSIVDEMQVVLTPVDGQPGVYRFDLIVVYRDGSTEKVASNIFYNENTQEICGEDGKTAVLGFNMNMDQKYTYTGIDVWQRNFGFCIEYDIFCYLTPYIMNYTTQRIKFNYGGKEWMCQLWKGTYFITNGAEVGFYNRPMGSIGSFYYCVEDEDMLEMSFELYHKDELLIRRDKVKHWWITGFEVDSTGYLPHALTLITTITMKDEEMFDAFTKALRKKRFVLDYETDGLDVTIKW